MFYCSYRRELQQKSHRNSGTTTTQLNNTLQLSLPRALTRYFPHPPQSPHDLIPSFCFSSSSIWRDCINLEGRTWEGKTWSLPSFLLAFLHRVVSVAATIVACPVSQSVSQSVSPLVIYSVSQAFKLPVIQSVSHWSVHVRGYGRPLEWPAGKLASLPRVLHPTV